MEKKSVHWYWRTGLLWLIFLFFALISVKAEAAGSTFEFFYDNACASCSEDEKIYEIFEDEFSKEEREQLDYEIRTYNVFHKSNKELFEKRIQESGRSREDCGLPVLIANGKWLCGYDQIKSTLRGALLGDEDSLKQTEETAADGEKPAEDIVSDENTSSFNEKFLDGLEEYGFTSQDKVMLLFTTYSCDDCNRVKDYLKDEDIAGNISVLEFNIAEGGYVEVLQELFELYRVPEASRKVPIVFYGKNAIAGADDICSRLKDSIESEDTSYQALREELDGLSESREEGKASSLLALFGAGLLAGFNPCSISMLLMLFSILLTAQASVLKNGALYLGGKYLTYFGLGVGIYFAASMIDQEVLDAAGKAVNIVITVLFIGASFMNLLDFWNVRREEYGKVRMQLPSALRRFNHKMIKNAGNASGKILPLLVLGLGIAISLGEFFCTGQIYMASILYMLRADSGNIGHILISFLVYVTAMCVPAAIFIFIIYKTKNTNRISDFMLAHMDIIKLANAVLFLGFALYFIFIL